MKSVIALLITIATSACATSSVQKKDDWKASADALERAANDFVSKMTPEERAKFENDVERSATAEMQALAAKCGTSLVFSNETAFADRTVWTAPGSTSEQTTCVQSSYPFVKVPAS